MHMMLYPDQGVSLVLLVATVIGAFAMSETVLRLGCAVLAARMMVHLWCDHRLGRRGAELRRGRQRLPDTDTEICEAIENGTDEQRARAAFEVIFGSSRVGSRSRRPLLEQLVRLQEVHGNVQRRDFTAWPPRPVDAIQRADRLAETLALMALMMGSSRAVHIFLTDMVVDPGVRGRVFAHLTKTIGSLAVWSLRGGDRSQGVRDETTEPDHERREDEASEEDEARRVYEMSAMLGALVGLAPGFLASILCAVGVGALTSFLGIFCLFPATGGFCGGLLLGVAIVAGGGWVVGCAVRAAARTHAGTLSRWRLFVVTEVVGAALGWFVSWSCATVRYLFVRGAGHWPIVPVVLAACGAPVAAFVAFSYARRRPDWTPLMAFLGVVGGAVFGGGVGMLLGSMGHAAVVLLPAIVEKAVDPSHWRETLSGVLGGLTAATLSWCTARASLPALRNARLRELLIAGCVLVVGLLGTAAGGASRDVFRQDVGAGAGAVHALVALAIAWSMKREVRETIAAGVMTVAILGLTVLDFLWFWK